MKIADYIREKLGKFSVELSDAELSALLIEQQIDENAEYELGSGMIVKKALVAFIPDMLLMAEVSEGGYSIKWNIEGIKAYYSQLCSEIDSENAMSTIPKVKDQSNRW